MSNEKLVMKVLRTLPKRFAHKVTAIEEAHDWTTMSLDELIGNLATFEMSLNEGESSKKKGVALKAASVDVDDEELGVLDVEVNFNIFTQWRIGSNDKLKVKVVHERCLSEEVRHMRNHCNASGGRDNNISDVNVVDDYADSLLLPVDCSIGSWILDSGASFHTTSSRDIMVYYIAGDYGTVHLADGEPLNIVGMGDVTLKLSNGSTWKLTKVRHVPKLVKSLISVSQLDGDGYRTTFGDSNWKVARGAMTIARG
ncbi:hypothetical protein LIER_08015 [Lithospermum erythrorhizon]|uniref:Retrovirus-related Pol polyprotein from transposon TNT 1-94-like beta-barrel domain-containing protein n=1 Tax=Lithospermum erythrorhizon TaxID=34254 RepID=A0AAV3PD40_LITER